MLSTSNKPLVMSEEDIIEIAYTTDPEETSGFFRGDLKPLRHEDYIFSQLKRIGQYVEYRYDSDGNCTMLSKRF